MKFLIGSSVTFNGKRYLVDKCQTYKNETIYTIHRLKHNVVVSEKYLEPYIYASEKLKNMGWTVEIKDAHIINYIKDGIVIVVNTNQKSILLKHDKYHDGINIDMVLSKIITQFLYDLREE